MLARRRISVFVVLVMATLLAGGCTRTRSERGVEPDWQDLTPAQLAVGETTKSDVMALLGPPSQVITHDRGVIFYYLHEEAQTRGMILVLYNRSETDTRYDRAIFFFDENGLLLDYSVSEAGGDS